MKRGVEFKREFLVYIKNIYDGQDSDILRYFLGENKEHPYLRNGDIIAKTQEAIILENLIGQLLFNIKK